MGSKVISITEDVYKLLKSVQFPKESFGDTIKRLCNQTTAKNLYNIVENDFNNISIPKEVWDSFEIDVTQLRKRPLTNSDLEL